MVVTVAAPTVDILPATTVDGSVSGCAAEYGLNAAAIDNSVSGCAAIKDDLYPSGVEGDISDYAATGYELDTAVEDGTASNGTEDALTATVNSGVSGSAAIKDDLLAAVVDGGLSGCAATGDVLHAPLLMVVSVAVPPLETRCSPPLIVVFVAVPPPDTDMYCPPRC